jgi:hypothetical protein
MFTPTQEDVDRYRRLRAASRALNNKLVKTIPREAYEDIGTALGIMRNGVLTFDNEAETSVLADCCLFDWYEDGENLVSRYAKSHDANRSADENYLLDAYQRAEFRVLVAQSVVRGAGLHFLDILANEELFVMDTAMSQFDAVKDAMLATRTIPLGEYWMTGGAGLPVQPSESFSAAMKRIEEEAPELFEYGFGLLVVRAALDCGAAENIRYAGPSGPPKKRRIEPKHQWRRR